MKMYGNLAPEWTPSTIVEICPRCGKPGTDHTTECKRKTEEQSAIWWDAYYDRAADDTY